MTMALVDCGNGVRLERGVPCVLSDGVTLVSDHYYPAGAGPWPTLLMRQPYGRDIASTVVYAHPVWFARHGYHVVIQDVRGRGDSEGEFYPFRNEGRDGAETIAWLRNHAACNGRIGMYGFSYQGATQLLAAAEQPEGLVVHRAAHDGGGSLSRLVLSSGRVAFEFDPWLGHPDVARRCATQRVARSERSARGCVGEHPRAGCACSVRGTSGDCRSRVAELCARLVRASRAGRRIGAVQDISTRLERITIPALHIAGWFDTYLEGSIAGYLALRNGAGSGVCARASVSACRALGAYSLGRSRGRYESRRGREPRIPTTLLLRWFNHWLKDSDEFAGEPRVRYFALGPNEWRSAEEWPTACGMHSICAARATPIRARAMARLRSTAPIGRRAARCFCL